MALASSSLGYYLSRPSNESDLINLEPKKEESNESIFAKLDSGFSIFKKLVIKGGYKDLLSNLESKITVFAFPDSLIPSDIKPFFDKIDNVEARNLIGIHILTAPKMWQQLSGDRMLLPSYHRHQLLYLNGPQQLIGLGEGETFQISRVIGMDNFFKNGVVHVIERPLLPRIA